MTVEKLWISVSNVHYYYRIGHYGTALAHCDERVRENREGECTLYKGLLLIAMDRTAEGMRVLEPLRAGPYSLGALQALKVGHLKAKSPDKESLREIEADIGKQQRGAEEDNLFSAAAVLYLTGNAQKAKVFVEKAMNGQPDNPKFQCLAGWIELALGRDLKGAQKFFETSAGKLYPDAFLGRAKILEGRHSPQEMKVVAKEVATQLATFMPAHLEAIRATMMSREWDAVSKMLTDVLMVQQENVHAHILLTIYAVCIRGTQTEAAITDLLTAFDATEAGNHTLAFSLADTFVRVAVKNTPLLVFCKKMLERALNVTRKPEYLSIAVRIMIYSDDHKEALNIAKELVEMGSDEPRAILSIGMCYLMTGRINDAASQYNFIKEANSNMHNVPVFMYMGGIVARFKENSFEKFFAAIKNAVDTHIAKLQSCPFGLEFIRQLEPAFLVAIALQLFDYAPLIPTKSPDTTLKEIDRILSIIHENCPGLSQVTYLLARVKYLCFDNDGAEKLIERSLDRNETIADAYLLRAQIKIDRGRIEEAEHCLDTGLSFNFAVRDSCLFHLIKAKVHKKRGDHQRAAELLRGALKLPQKEANNNLLIRSEREDSHRINVYLELIDSLQSLRKTEEAEGIMQQALANWKGKPEEEQLLLMNAQLYVAKGDPEAALNILSQVQPNQPNYQAARVKMASIYLEEKKDKRMFTICYKELHDNDPSSATFALLGDAYMSVQMPAQAIEVYEKALKANPKDSALAQKIGEAYVQCHLYSKAVNYYEASMKAGKDSQMRMKLANLLFQIGNVEKCERVLKDPLEKEPSPTEPSTMSAHVSYWMLLSKLHFENGNWQEAIEDLSKAKTIQLRLLHKDGGNNVSLKKEAARICCNLAELHSNRRETNKAVDLYKEALSLNETDVKIILALAQLYMSMGKLHLCNQQCQIALNIDKNNDEATLMMADLLYLKNEGEQAIIHFSQLLDRYPNHYHALARTIELSWRSGDVDLAEKHLKKALDNNARASVDAGFNFCKGLHEWYCGEPNAALQAFNRARRDLEWGERAIYNMIEICLNPDNEIIGGEVIADESMVDENTREIGTKTAERFLKELRFKPGVDIKYSLMENFIFVASGNKIKIQQALTNLLEMVGTEPDKVASVGAVLGVARAYILLKQVPKAKQMLKRVIGQPWTLEDADYLEKCWLLLADLYINQNKPEQATNVLRTILQHNASSIKAFEFMGYLREKEQKWSDAAANYEEAWRLCKQRKPTIGYKLAYNYLKCKRLFDSIEVCHLVLKQYPTYPKIKKEIMDKARMNIRN